MARSRPVFLNPLQIQMPVGALTSIVHRATGVLLAASVPFDVYLLDLSLRSEYTFAQMASWLALPATKVVVLALIWALAHHALAGIRHLLTDISIGSTLNAARRSAWLVNLGGLAIVLFAAGVLLRGRGSRVCPLGSFSERVRFACWPFCRSCSALFGFMRPSYMEWRSWMSAPGLPGAVLVFSAALLSHIWVGLRDVLLDYARPAGLRRFLLGTLGAVVLGTGAWVVWIVLRAQH
jgi:succinate dehydrogenase / fumarate reductase, cytochrome b subunit